MKLREAHLGASKELKLSAPKLWYGSDVQVGPRASNTNGLDSIQKAPV